MMLIKNWTDALYTKLHTLGYRNTCLGLETVNLQRLSRHLLVRHPQHMRLNDGPAAKKPELPKVTVIITTWCDLPAKRWQIIFLNTVCLLIRVFNRLSHFLRICILLVPNYTHICTQWPQKIFTSFLVYEYPKHAEFHADFKSVEKIDKRAPRKSYFSENVWKLVVQKSTNSNFHTFLHCYKDWR